VCLRSPALHASAFALLLALWVGPACAQDDDQSVETGGATDDETEDDETDDDETDDDETDDDETDDEAAVRASFTPGGGFTLESEDGEHALTVSVRGQLQLDASIPRDADPGVELRIRRMRLDLTGHLFGENNRLVVSLAFTADGLGWDEDDGPSEAPLLDYYLELTYHRDLEVLLGQRRLPFARERMTSSRELSMVDRSIVDATFGLDRDLGVWLRSCDLLGLGHLRYWLGISSGEGRNEGVDGDLRFIYQARVELLPLGLFESYTQGDLDRESHPRLGIGFAYAYLDRVAYLRGLHGPRPDDGGTSTYHSAALDLLLLYAGWTLAAEVIVRAGERHPGTATDDEGLPAPVTPPSNGLGALLQVSYVLPAIPVELALRGATQVGIGASTSVEARSELGVGLNLYFAGHPYALQIDYARRFGDAFETGTDRIRVQLQATL
jgi:hypothetical protein